MEKLRKHYMEEESYGIARMWEFEWWFLYKTATSLKHQLRESVHFRRPVEEQHLMEERKFRPMFSYVQCFFQVPEFLTKQFATLLPVFKNTTVDGQENGPSMQDYADR